MKFKPANTLEQIMDAVNMNAMMKADDYTQVNKSMNKSQSVAVFGQRKHEVSRISTKQKQKMITVNPNDASLRSIKPLQQGSSTARSFKSQSQDFYVTRNPKDIRRDLHNKTHFKAAVTLQMQSPLLKSNNKSKDKIYDEFDEFTEVAKKQQKQIEPILRNPLI